LMKKFRSLGSDLAALSRELEATPRMGVMIGPDTYKIRLAVKSKGKGKSGGMRVITYLEIEYMENAEATDVYLLFIYEKSEYENISEQVLINLVKSIKEKATEAKTTPIQDEEE
jgi:hypothetical protein